MAQPAYSFTRYTATSSGGTLNIRTGPGVFGLVTINQIGSTGSFVTFVDSTSTSGTQIATMTPSALGSFVYQVTLANGLTVCTAGSSTGEMTLAWY